MYSIATKCAYSRNMHTHDMAHEAHHSHDNVGATDQSLAMIELLELDAQVLKVYLNDLTGWIADHVDRPPQRILDLGSGPGTGTFALTRQFPNAVLTAADASPQMLQRLEQAAEARGVSARVNAVEADLDESWTNLEEVGGFDLIWAASFIHHLADPDHGLAQAFSSLRPGGLLAVTEMDSFPRFLPEDIGNGQPGLEMRLHAATHGQPNHDWTESLDAAGFILESRRVFDVHVTSGQAGSGLNRYAQLFLAQLRSAAESHLSSDDSTALDALLDGAQPDSIMRRQDLTAHTPRTTWLVRRP